VISLASVREIIEGYIHGVISGEIVVGALVRKAVERHLADLEKQNTEDFPYWFCEEKAERICRFFPSAFRHSIGEWAGMPFELTGWQAFALWCIAGWQRQDDTRRFRKAYLSVARKNGKTTLIAGLCHYMAAADSEAGAQVFCCATKLDQAKVLFAEAERMLQRSPLNKRAKQTTSLIRYPGSNSYFRPLGSDKEFDGLNPHHVAFDELHAWKEHHRPFFRTMITGSASRRQPLFAFITTAGDDKSELWKEETEYAKNVVAGTITDDSVFALLYEIDEDDDPFDDKCWVKANPNLGVSVKMEYLRQQALEAKNKPQFRSSFIRYHCNRMVTSTEVAIDLRIWDQNTVELSDWKQAECVAAAVDLGGRDDLAAIAYVAKFATGQDDEQDRPIYRYEIKTRCFIATDTKRDLTQQPFSMWLHYDLLKKSQFVTTDLRDALLEDCQRYGVEKVAYDKYNAMMLGDELTQAGLTAVAFSQSHYMFNEPIREFLTLLPKGQIKHDGNELLRWCAGNAVIVRNRQDQWMFDKASSKDKIDPMVAAVMAFRLAMLEPQRIRGPLFIMPSTHR
jgi:phage terminase large subunit-like protein